MNEDQTNGVMAGVAVTLLLPLLIVYGASVSGLTLMLTWNWFVTPLTHITLHFWQAIGLSMLVALVKGPDFRHGDEKWWALLLRPWLLLLTAFVAHLFV